MHERNRPRALPAITALSLAAGALLAGALTLTCPSPAFAKAAYSQVIVFGDSLSDQGNTEVQFGYPPLPPYNAGRYSDGENWIDILGGQLGVKVTNSQSGGTNYSYAFATTGEQDAPPPLPFTALDLDQQEQVYLAAVNGKADPNALYVLEGGGTDILGLLFASQNDPLLLLFIGSLDLTGTQNLAVETNTLLKAGAKHILVPNVPDLGILPIITHQGGLLGFLAPSVATSAAQLWDEDFADALGPLTSGGNVILWDFYNTGTLALKAAKQFGITNTTTWCVPDFGVKLGVKNHCSPSKEPKHLFFDEVHFTGGGYFGMEQGAACALGLSNSFGWKQSQCLVSERSSRRSGRPVQSTLGNSYRGMAQSH